MPTATLMTETEVRKHFETALVAAALQKLMDAAEQEIDHMCGKRAYSGSTPAYTAISEVNYRSGGLPVLKLRYPPVAGSITEVKTTDSVGTETVLVAGVAEDYIIDGQLLRSTGYWGPMITIAYTPDVDFDRKTVVFLQLIQLELNAQPGQKFTGAATWQESYADYEQEKQRLLWSLCAPPVFA